MTPAQHWPNICSTFRVCWGMTSHGYPMFDLRRWPNNGQTLGRCIVFAGISLSRFRNMSGVRFGADAARYKGSICRQTATCIISTETRNTSDSPQSQITLHSPGPRTNTIIIKRHVSSLRSGPGLIPHRAAGIPFIWRHQPGGGESRGEDCACVIKWRILTDVICEKVPTHYYLKTIVCEMIIIGSHGDMRAITTPFGYFTLV